MRRTQQGKRYSKNIGKRECVLCIKSNIFSLSDSEDFCKESLASYFIYLFSGAAHNSVEYSKEMLLPTERVEKCNVVMSCVAKVFPYSGTAKKKVYYRNKDE